MLDPGAGTEAPSGITGSLAIFDLASPETGAQLLPGDAGAAGEDGFRLG